METREAVSSSGSDLAMAARTDSVVGIRFVEAVSARPANIAGSQQRAKANAEKLTAIGFSTIGATVAHLRVLLQEPA